jgi:hypothetical protein
VVVVVLVVVVVVLVAVLGLVRLLPAFRMELEILMALERGFSCAGGVMSFWCESFDVVGDGSDCGCADEIAGMSS